jgi:hypothetical protein
MTNLRNMINADVTELITFQPCAIFIAFLEVNILWKHKLLVSRNFHAAARNISTLLIKLFSVAMTVTKCVEFTIYL